jgi:hypothetical protein
MDSRPIAQVAGAAPPIVRCNGSAANLCFQQAAALRAAGKDKTMSINTKPVTRANRALDEAAEVVTEAIRAATLTAMRGAKTCGCRSCQAAASQTFHWAVEMMHEDEATVDQAA